VRVVGGALKGRRLSPPTWEGLRPTGDKLKETIFNVLAPRVGNARVIDLYAGTGALGIEALSRGASLVVLVESDRRAQQLITKNLESCGIQRGCVIIRATAVRALETLKGRPDFTPFDIVLLDPPYDSEPALALDGLDTVVAEQGIVVFEHARRTPAPDRAGRLVKRRELSSGDSALSFYAIPI
jgi:16S rRNA (guanine966-N2)-methyltransferase